MVTITITYFQWSVLNWASIQKQLSSFSSSFTFNSYFKVKFTHVVDKDLCSNFASLYNCTPTILLSFLKCNTVGMSLNH